MVLMRLKIGYASNPFNLLNDLASLSDLDDKLIMIEGATVYIFISLDSLIFFHFYAIKTNFPFSNFHHEVIPIIGIVREINGKGF